MRDATGFKQRTLVLSVAFASTSKG